MPPEVDRLVALDKEGPAPGLTVAVGVLVSLAYGAGQGAACVSVDSAS